MPWCRIQPYLARIFLGYLLHRQRGYDIKLDWVGRVWVESFQFSDLNGTFKVVVLIGWIVALGALFAVVYGLNLPSYFEGEMAMEPTKATTITYGGLHRLNWGTALGWVVWACAKGYGGKLLSLLFDWNSCTEWYK